MLKTKSYSKIVVTNNTKSTIFLIHDWFLYISFKIIIIYSTVLIIPLIYVTFLLIIIVPIILIITKITKLFFKNIFLVFFSFIRNNYKLLLKLWFNVNYVSHLCVQHQRPVDHTLLTYTKYENQIQLIVEGTLFFKRNNEIILKATQARQHTISWTTTPLTHNNIYIAGSSYYIASLFEKRLDT